LTAGVLISLNIDYIVGGIDLNQQPEHYLPQLYNTFVHEALHKYGIVNSMPGWPQSGTHPDWNLSDESGVSQFISAMAALGIDLLANDTPNDQPCS
jgi:hypothetical protein